MVNGKKKPERNKLSSSKTKIKNHQGVKKGIDFLWRFRIELFSGVLLLIGIILSFFYIHIGGLLVGLAVGIYFYDEIYNYFIQIRGFYTTRGLFKTLMFIGTFVYLLIAIPAFVIFMAIGFGVIFLYRWFFRK